MDIANKKIGKIGRNDNAKIVSPVLNKESNISKKDNKNIYIFIAISVSIFSLFVFFIYRYLNAGDQNVAKINQDKLNTKYTQDNNSIFVSKNNKQEIDLNPQSVDEQYTLAMKYLKGDKINKDYNEAIKWFDIAAKQEHRESQVMLGQIYYYGEFTKPDFKKALIWNTLAASQGVKESQYILGLMYENGEGVTKDIQESQKWFKLSFEKGMKEAKDKIIIKEEVKEKETIKAPAKIVDNHDISEVNNYLSRVEKEKNKTLLNSNNKDREIIWN